MVPTTRNLTAPPTPWFKTSMVVTRNAITMNLLKSSMLSIHKAVTINWSKVDMLLTCNAVTINLSKAGMLWTRNANTITQNGRSYTRRWLLMQLLCSCISKTVLSYISQRSHTPPIAQNARNTLHRRLIGFLINMINLSYFIVLNIGWYTEVQCYYQPCSYGCSSVILTLEHP